MLPFAIPPGLTPRALVTEVLPREHPRLVPADAGRASVHVCFTGGARFSLRIDGSTLEVDETSHPADAADLVADLALFLDATTLQHFLDDWSGPGRYLPRFRPRQGVALLTDPRLLRRVAMATGRVELALTDFEGGRATMSVASGARAIRANDPDVTIESTMTTFERLLAGTLAPDEAIVDGHVQVRGKPLVAMQFALALAPFFPPRA